MRDWGFLVPPEERLAVEKAVVAFRNSWAKYRPPWPHTFDGSVKDARAIDYMAYEGIPFPDCGLEGAALVCGEIIRRAAGLEWVTSYRGDWFIASPERDWPAVAICPVVRLHELHFASRDGPCMRFVIRAARDCIEIATGEAELKLRAILAHDQTEKTDLQQAGSRKGVSKKRR